MWRSSTMKKNDNRDGKKYDQMILNKLLSKYERSLVSRGANMQTQNIWFTVNEKCLPEYFDLTSDACEVINRDARALEMAGLVELQWKNKIENHILEKVKLNLSSVDDAYAYACRSAKNAQIEELLAYMDAQMTAHEHDGGEPCETVCRCFDYIRQRVLSGLSVKKYVDFQDIHRFSDVIKGARAVLSNDRECFEREFSMSVYGDSKRFEQLKSSIRTVLADFGDESRSRGDRVFEDYGILEKPSTILIKGCGKALIAGMPFDLGVLTQGMGFAGDDLSSVEWAADNRVCRIITIENLTAFYRFSCPDAVIVYLGGFSNRTRVELLKRLHQAYPEAEMRHFGDLDLGGFRILLDLRRKTELDVRPLHMDAAVLEKYRDVCKALTAGDKTGLKKLLENIEDDAVGGALMPWQETVRNAVCWMLENGLKLEQEIVVYEMMKGRI